ncbi:MAG: hypothetical protein ACPK85_04750 [Methanosarcina sp.]
MALAEIFDQLKELEKKFNEIKYPSEEAFQPDFCLRIKKAERDSLKHDFTVYRIEDLLEGIEK